MGSDWQTLTRDAIRGAARLSERRFVCYRLDLSTRGFTGPLCCLSVRPAVLLTYVPKFMFISLRPYSVAFATTVAQPSIRTKQGNR